ncbi:unnamed protein product [Prunus armeniaca]
MRARHVDKDCAQPWWLSVPSLPIPRFGQPPSPGHVAGPQPMSTVPHRKSTQQAHLPRLIKGAQFPKMEVIKTYGIPPTDLSV